MTSPLNFKTIALLLLVVTLFITKAVDTLLLEVHLVDLVILIFVSVVIFSASELRVNLWLLFYLCALFFSILMGFLIGNVHTGVYIAPCITRYQSLLQPIVGYLYAARYMLMFGITIGTRFVVSRDNYSRVIDFLFFLLMANCIFIFIEYLSPSIHNFIQIKTIEKEEFSFVYRGFSLMFNVYDSTISMIIFSALALYEYVSKNKRKIYLFFCMLAFVSIISLGTRIGYVGILIFWFIMLITSEYGWHKKLLFLLCAFVVSAGFFYILYVVSPDIRKILISFIVLGDPVGSMQRHIAVFLESLRLIGIYPLGVGIGKTNFAAIKIPYFFNPESFTLSLALDAGIVSVLLFLGYHWWLLRKLKKISYHKKLASIYSALIVTFILLSTINVQIFNSVLVSTLIPIVVGIFYNLSIEPNKAAGFRSS